MNIFDILKNEHINLKALLDQLASAEEPKQREALIAEAADKLVRHSRAEEAVLYNLLRDMDEEGELVRHSYQEHMKAETILRGLQVTEAVSVNWKDGVEMLRKEIEHHVGEEEGKVFPAAQKLLSDSDAVELGEAFLEVKEHTGSGVIRSQIELISNLVPQRFRKSFVDFLGQDNRQSA